jgi:hypothetical protein
MAIAKSFYFFTILIDSLGSMHACSEVDGKIGIVTRANFLELLE